MGEWRQMLDSDEVKALLETFRPQLYERFADIVAKAKTDPPPKKGVKSDKGPAKAKGPAPKANEKQNKKGERRASCVPPPPPTRALPPLPLHRHRPAW